MQTRDTAARGGHLEWVEGWAEPSGIPKRKSVPRGEWRPWGLQNTPQGWAPGGKENVSTLTAASLQRRCRTCCCVARLCHGVACWPWGGGPMGRGREEEKEGGGEDAWGEDEECLENTVLA